MVRGKKKIFLHSSTLFLTIGDASSPYRQALEVLLPLVPRCFNDQFFRTFESYIQFHDTQKCNFTLQEWDNLIGQTQVNKDDLDKLLMNYFITEGYEEVARLFSAESNLQPEISLDLIDDRLSIRNLVQSGKIQEAIEKVNDLYPEQQNLIELIRNGKVVEAIEFAREELGPYGIECKSYLEELERTMSLLALDITSDSPASHLLEHHRRQRTASELNLAILEIQCLKPVPTFSKLIRLLFWCQKLFKERADFPTIDFVDNI